jgi:hypothetical protein
MRWTLAAALVLSSFTAQADPGRGLTGNDTGGIIQWTPETDVVFHDIAATHCARWNRIASFTSVHRAYGEYLGFRCIVDRRYDPRKVGYSWTQRGYEFPGYALPGYVLPGYGVNDTNTGNQ